jgi:Putative MetA-pathway of phenol degradation
MTSSVVKWQLSVAFVAAVVLSSTVVAQELEPRSFNNIPIGQTFLSAAVARSEGDLAPPGGSPLEEAELTIDVLAAAVSHTFALAGDSAKVDMVVARTCYEGWGILLGEYVEGRRCEYLDPKFKLTWNFYGAPAMTPQEFRSWKQGVVVGASLAVGAPWGTYNSENLINGGANRWAVKPSIGMSQRLGNWQWELKAGAVLYEDNDDFFNGIKVEQDPLYSTSFHLIYIFSRGWLSLDGNYFAGGRTTKDGVRQDDRQDNSRWGLTWTRPLSPQLLVKLNASTGVVTRIGNDFDNFGLGLVYRF